MPLQTLGTSDLSITPIGLGTWAIGGDWKLGWGPQDDADSIAAIKRAVELGINWIDTAPVYGLGHAEPVVARALETIDEVMKPLVFTKCGLVWDDEGNVGHCIKADSIRREIDDSLQRLQTEQLDLCQIQADPSLNRWNSIKRQRILSKRTGSLLSSYSMKYTTAARRIIS